MKRAWWWGHRRSGSKPVNLTERNLERAIKSSGLVRFPGGLVGTMADLKCEVCRGSLEGKRPHARTCSAKCRQIASRKRRKGK